MKYLITNLPIRPVHFVPESDCMSDLVSDGREVVAVRTNRNLLTA